MACKVNNVMSILFSGQELTAVFSVTVIHVLHLLFQTTVKHYLYFLRFYNRHFFWAFKMGKLLAVFNYFQWVESQSNCTQGHQ